MHGELDVDEAGPGTEDSSGVGRAELIELELLVALAGVAVHSLDDEVLDAWSAIEIALAGDVVLIDQVVGVVLAHHVGCVGKEPRVASGGRVRWDSELVVGVGLEGEDIVAKSGDEILVNVDLSHDSLVELDQRLLDEILEGSGVGGRGDESDAGDVVEHF